MSITAQNLVVLGTGAGTFNITPFIAVPSYKVDDKVLGDSWEDSNWYGHIDVVRYRAQGTFTVWFDDPSDFEAFTDFIETHKGDDEYIYASVYLNKKHTVKQDIEVMISWEPSNDLPLYGIKAHDGYEITIQER